MVLVILLYSSILIIPDPTLLCLGFNDTLSDFHLVIGIHPASREIVVLHVVVRNPQTAVVFGLLLSVKQGFHVPVVAVLAGFLEKEVYYAPFLFLLLIHRYAISNRVPQI